MGFRDKARTPDRAGLRLPARRVATATCAVILLSLVAWAGSLPVAAQPPAAGNAADASVPANPASVSPDEFFVSPITGDAYRIQKDIISGTYELCDLSGGACFASAADILDREARALPAWAVVVEPSLRARVGAVKEARAADRVVDLVIEVRGGRLAEISAEAWDAVAADIHALSRAPSSPLAGAPPSRSDLERLDALVDATRRGIYDRARDEVAPVLRDVRLRVESLGGAATGSTPVLPALFARLPLSAVPALASDPAVGRISESRLLHATMDVSAYAIRADTYWTNGFTGGTWDLGVMDTGIDPTHPALTVDQAGVFHAQAQTDPFYQDNPTNPDDLHSHGTHVAGTVASADSTYRGVAYGLDWLINVKAGYWCGGGCGAMWDEDAMAGVDWAVGTVGADVISLSFGGAPGSGDTPFERFFDAVVDELGVVVAIAAGNSGTAGVTEPGAGYNILSVAAVNDGNTAARTNDVLASFSSRGPTGDGRLKPDIAAPGVDIMSTYAFWEGGNPDFVSFSGTSMATPHIAATAILLMDQQGVGTPLLHKALLLNTAEDRTPAGPDTGFGWGYVDMSRAYAHRAHVMTGTVDDGAVPYTFYRVAAFTGDRTTIAWNRHATYRGANYPLTYFPLNDIDLFSYDESSGLRLASSTRTVDNVEQVTAPSAVMSNIIKVRADGPIGGVSVETFGIAFDAAAQQVAPPSLSAVLTAPPTAEIGSVFTVSADVSNAGEIAAHAVSVTLNLPPGLSLVSGGNPQALPSIPAGGSAPASWQVRGNTLGSKTVTASVVSTSYEEAFSGSSGPQSVDIIDTVAPESSVDPLPAFTTAAVFDLFASATDGTGVASVELLYRREGGAWTSHGVDPSAPWGWTFDSAAAGGDGLYEYFSVATDVASNVEAWPASPDAWIRVDTAPPVSRADSLPTYANTATITVTATASDPGSGVGSVDLYARKDTGPWFFAGTATAEPWSWTFDSVPQGGDGVYQFYTIATDGLGNAEVKTPTPEATVTIDTTPPTSTASVSGVLGANGWYVSDVTVAVSPSDVTSGIAALQVWVDGVPSASPVQVSTDGDHVVEFRATDRAGNVEALQQVAFRIDRAAPFTTASVSGSAGNGGWYVSAVTTTLAALDDTSGVATTWYDLDGTGWALYGTPVLVATEGDHAIQYYSTDDAGNVETGHEVTFRLDLTPPESSHALAGSAGGAGWHVSAVTVTLSGSDALSGLGGIDYSADGGLWTPYGAPLTIAADGDHRVEWRAEDVAGNVEPVDSVNFRIDTTPPEVGVDAPAPGELLHSKNVMLDWTATDALSGLAGCEVALDDGSWSPATGTSHTFSGVADGSHTAMVRCRDAAGNTAGTEAAFSVNTDILDPLGPYGWWLDLVILLFIAVTIIAIIAVAARRRKKEEPVGPAVAPSRKAAPEAPPPVADDTPPPPDDEFDWVPPPPD